MKTTTVHGQPSWKISNNKVELFLTEMGGHLAPVFFKLPGQKVQPFSVNPWAEEKPLNDFPPLIKALRGDFFCLPFGGNQNPYRGEHHPIHGETANRNWKFENLEQEGGVTTLTVSMQQKVRRGKVTKKLRLKRDETVVYCQHTIEGMSGKMSLGHHATLKFPDEPGSGKISTSGFIHGQVLPVPFEKPEEKGYISFRPSAEFRRLDRVPRLDGSYGDISKYPSERGFENLLMISSSLKKHYAWTAVTFAKEGYVWVALKDPKILQSTVFWMSNGGRHYAPWNGRHTSVIGLEDVTAYFHVGLAESAKNNHLNKKGVMTTLPLEANKPLDVNYIMAVVPVPRGFDEVKSLRLRNNEAVLASRSGKMAAFSIQGSFLQDGLVK